MPINCISTITFSTSKLKDVNLVWLDAKNYNKYNGHKADSGIEQHFLDEFAFSTQSTLINKEKLIAENIRTFHAERYGGIGLGGNGGGARCGNINQLQVKGIGATPLVGEGSDELHSYGGLSLFDAVYESIYCCVLNEILPLGCVNCIGIIFSGENNAYLPSELYDADTTVFNKGRGALLVREVATRPAHFLSARNFKPARQYKYKFHSDLYRTRQANKALAEHFGSQNDFIWYLGNFLASCANQFAFAKLFRIYHGTITPSNIALDGRWLDLTTASFVDGGKNYYLLDHNEPFFSEHTSPLKIVDELLYFYGKFNLVKLNSAPLASYYNEQYEAYLSHHFAKVLGLTSEKSPKIVKSKAYTDIFKAFNKVAFNDGSTVEYVEGNTEYHDPITEFISCLFSKVNSATKLNSNDLSYSLNVLLKTYYKENQGPYSFNAFIISTSIKALRRLHYVPVFYRAKLQFGLFQDIEDADINYFGQLIEDYKNIAHWIFTEDEDNMCIVFEYNQLTLAYELTTEQYILTTHNKISKVESAFELTKIIPLLDDSLFIINHFNFKKPILAILNNLSGLPTAHISNKH